MVLPQYKLRKPIAVFARNHRHLLDEAIRVSEEDPESLVVFRARISWSSAKAALIYHETLPIYFSPCGGHGTVEYEATLTDVLLNPQPGDAETQACLEHSTASTRGERLWGERVQTLYLLKNCREIPGFPMTSLVKVQNDTPISDDYGYSYSIVHPYIAGIGFDAVLGPDEGEVNEFPEGERRKVAVNRFERSRGARRACIEHYGLQCSVCGMSFEAVYGERGKDYIEVHHIKPLSEVDDSYRVNPIKDLRPVCPNCHAMLHREPSCTVKELYQIITAVG